MEIRFTPRERVKIFEFLKSNRVEIKVDFAFYPYKRIKKGFKVQNVRVDNLFDIATNKLQTIINRTEVKDFVDLYFLLQKFALLSVRQDAEKKFGMRIDNLFFGSELAKVRRIAALPKMLKPLTIENLKAFFIQQATKLTSTIIEE